MNFKLLLALEALAKKENQKPPHIILTKDRPWWTKH